MIRNMKRTFKQWNSLGYNVRKGSKAVGFNDNNEALFDDSQVKEKLTVESYDGVDYSKDPTFWAKTSPNQMYEHMLRFPEKYEGMSDQAGAILARNLR